MGEITRCRIVTLLAQVIDGAMQASGQRSLQLRPGWSRCLCDETRPSRPSKCRGCRPASPAPGGLVTNLTLAENLANMFLRSNSQPGPALKTA
jgi:hypothetical protein